MNTPFPYIIRNSPIEFILVGPFNGKDSIIVRSSNAALDLVGLANFRYKTQESLLISSNNFPILSTSRQLNFVDSKEARDINDFADRRYSVYRFVWVGYSNRFGREQVLDYFNESLDILRQAIIEENMADIELNISGIILQCSLVNQKRLKARRSFFVVLTLYVLGFLSMLGYYIFTRMF